MHLVYYIIFNLTLANDIHTGDQIPPTNHSSQFKDFEDKVLRNADDTQCSQCRRANGPYSERGAHPQ